MLGATDDCLPRSLVLYRELSRQGVDPELVIGFGRTGEVTRRSRMGDGRRSGRRSVAGLDAGDDPDVRVRRPRAARQRDVTNVSTPPKRATASSGR